MQAFAVVLYSLSAWCWFSSAMMDFDSYDLGELDGEMKYRTPKTCAEFLFPFIMKNLEYHSYARITRRLNCVAAGCAALALFFDKILPIFCASH